MYRKVAPFGARVESAWNCVVEWRLIMRWQFLVDVLQSSVCAAPRLSETAANSAGQRVQRIINFGQASLELASYMNSKP